MPIHKQNMQFLEIERGVADSSGKGGDTNDGTENDRNEN